MITTELDIDDIVAAHDSKFINGQKHRFATICEDWAAPADDDDDDEETLTVEYHFCDAIGHWTVDLFPDEYKHILTLDEDGRNKFLQSIGLW